MAFFVAVAPWMCRYLNDGGFPQSALSPFTLQEKDLGGSVVSLQPPRTYEETHRCKRQGHCVKWHYSMRGWKCWFSWGGPNQIWSQTQLETQVVHSASRISIDVYPEENVYLARMPKGNSLVTCGIATAMTSIFSLGEDVGDMSKLTTKCRGERWDIPLMLKILTIWEDLGSCRAWVRHSEMSEVVEVESRSARALTAAPSGEWARIWHVTRRCLV